MGGIAGIRWQQPLFCTNRQGREPHAINVSSSRYNPHRARRAMENVVALHVGAVRRAANLVFGGIRIQRVFPRP